MNEKLEASIEKHKDIIASYDCYSENEYEYDDYEENLKTELKEMGNEWHIDAKNINWQGRSGSLETDDIDSVISATLFHDGQCRTEIWRDTEVSFGSAHIPEAHTKILQGVCYHHDCPTGSWFTITGIDEKV